VAGRRLRGSDGDDLDRDSSVEPTIVALVHDCHAPAPEFPMEHVASGEQRRAAFHLDH